MLKQGHPDHILFLDLDHILVRKVIRQRWEWEGWTARGLSNEAVAGSRERGSRYECGGGCGDEKECVGDRYFLGDSSALNSQAERNEEEEEVEGGDEEEQVGRRRVLRTLATIPKAEGSPSTIQHKNHCVQM